MKQEYYSVEHDGFYGCWYPLNRQTKKGMIVMLGDSSDDLMAKTGVRWLHQYGIAVMAMSADKKDYSYHSYPLERIGKAIAVMKEKGMEKIGIVGASTTGMLALCAASYYPDITLTIALTPCDFIMQGFIRDGLDGCEERPAEGESTLTWNGKPLAYLPYAYKHPDYWHEIEKEAKQRKDKIASRHLFDESERIHPLTEEKMIQIERIHGTIICIGAEDDSLWDTCRYIRRMEARMKQRGKARFVPLCYKYGTHFVFPQSMIRMVLPFGESALFGLLFHSAKLHPNECRETRQDIARHLEAELIEW